MKGITHIKKSLLFLGMIAAISIPTSAIAQTARDINRQQPAQQQASAKATPATAQQPPPTQTNASGNLSGLSQSLSQLNSQGKQATQSIQQPIQQVQQAKNSLNSAFGSVKNSLNQSLNQISQTINGTLNGITSLGGSTYGGSENIGSYARSGGQQNQSTFTSYLDEIKGFYSQVVTGNVHRAFPNASMQPGALGIPDPSMAEAGVYNQISQQKDASQIQKTPGRVSAMTREITKGVANNVLGTQGQARLFKQQQAMTASTIASTQMAQQATASAQNATSIADEARSKNVTQDVMKDIAQQNATIANEQAMTASVLNQTNAQLANLSSQAMDLQTQIAAANLQLSSIDVGLEAIHSSQKGEQDSQYALTKHSLAQVYIPALALKGSTHSANSNVVRDP